MQSFDFTRAAPHPVAPPGFRCVSRHVTGAGVGLFLFAQVTGSAEARYALTLVDAGPPKTIDLPPLPRGMALCDLFPDGRVLLAAHRSRWRGPGDFDLNGAIIDPATGQVTRFLAGDGIEAVGIDAEGRIWVGYFDEGVFGNYGWSHPGPHGPGSGGLVCFDDTGQSLWSANSEERGLLIYDCYALNVAPDAVWAFFYDAFQLMRIGPDFTMDQSGPFDTAGAHAFAISDHAVLFSHGYHDAPGQFHIVRRHGPPDTAPEPVTGQLPDGVTFKDMRLFGRGPVLHVMGPQGWYRADMNQMAAIRS